jgi:hypothetical protein
MTNVFILRVKTAEVRSLIRFKSLMKNLSDTVQLLSSKDRNEDNHFEILYLVHTERLLQIKKMIDEEINYDVLELFEYVKW